MLPNGVITALRSYVTDGSVQHLLLTVGGQWDVAPAFTLGALVTAPGLRIGGKSMVTLSETVFDAAGGESDLAFRDPEARFDYKLPLRATAGATFRYSRGQVELDLRYHGAEDAYELLSSDSVATQITTDASGVPVISHPTFTPVLNQARSIVGFALGANFSLSRSVRVHGGAFIDPFSGQRTFAVDLPSRRPHRSVRRRVARIRKPDRVAGRLVLVGDDDSAGGRALPGWAVRHHRREHSYLHRALLDLVYVLTRRAPYLMV